MEPLHGNASGEGSPTGAADAHASLQKVLGYTGAEIVENACRRIPVPRAAVGADGLISDTAIRAGVVDVLSALADHVRGWRFQPK